jgi:hypothetical protein
MSLRAHHCVPSSVFACHCLSTPVWPALSGSVLSLKTGSEFLIGPNYVKNAAIPIGNGDYTPDEQRNLLGNFGTIGVGFAPLVVVRSARDLTQNLSNWEWT